MSETTTNVFLAGVGGQGVVLVNRLLARAAVLSGFEAMCTDTHGLAMRGGAVMGMLRIGPVVGTSIFPAGAGDLLLGLEPLEVLRWRGMLRTGATVVVSRDEIWPSAVCLEESRYPGDWRGLLEQKGLNIREVAGKELARRAGNVKMLNVVMAGALTRFLPLDLEALKDTIEILVPEGTAEKNIRAFEFGRESVG